MTDNRQARKRFDYDFDFPSDEGTLKINKCYVVKNFQMYHIQLTNRRYRIINVFCFFSAGILINIECKAWAKNIHHDRHDRLGSVHFELMID